MPNEGTVNPSIPGTDTNISNLCMGKGPEYFFFEYPSPVEANECTAKQLVNLKFSLAVTCGLIKLNSVVIYGNLATRATGQRLEARFPE